MLPQDLQHLLDQPIHQWPQRDWALLDIREAGEFDAGQIPGATNLPRRLIERRLPNILPTLSTPIVLIDAGRTPFGTPDNRASYAEATIRALGYTQIRRLEGGLAAWQEAGGSLVTGTNVPSKLFGERLKAEGELPSITAADLQTQLAAGARITIRDVRTREEFDHHHLPGALSSPGFDLAGELEAFIGRDLPLVISCAGRTRSIIATATARLLGCDRAVSLENGTMGWRLAGYDVARGPEPEGSRFADSGIIRDRAEAMALAAGVRHVAPHRLAQKLALADRPVLLDLRPVADFTAGHIQTAVNLPGGQAIQRTDDYLPAPGLPLVLCDTDELRALLAGYWLRRMGFAEVRVLAGGLSAWRAAGLPVATGRHDARALPEALLTPTAPEISASALASAPRPVVDIRTSRAYAEGHIPGARWVPRGWLETAVAQDASLATDLILVGDDRVQMQLSAAALAERGHPLPAVLAGGMKAWNAAGLPVETGIAPDALWLPDLFEPPYAGGTKTMQAYLDWEVALHAPP